MRKTAWTALVLVVLAAATTAQGQGRGGGDVAALAGRRAALPERSPKPATAETEAWIAREIQVGTGWRIVAKDADGIILAQPAGAVRPDGVVATQLRLEYRNPLTINRREVRSVSANLDIDCGTRQLSGQVAGFDGQNLAGKKMGLEAADVVQNGPGTAKVVTLNPWAEGLKLLTNSVVREQCLEGHRAIAGRFGGEWRPLLADETGVRLLGAAQSLGLDRKLDVTFRLEAKNAQADTALKWRSAIAKMKLDCVEGTMTADTTLYSGANEAGSTASLSFAGAFTPTGLLRTHAVGEAATPAAATAASGGGRGGFPGAGGDTGPGKSVVGMLRDGAMVWNECEDAKAKLASALATPGDPLRAQAESWASQTLNTKGFRLPTFVPEGVQLLSDEVMSIPGGARRAVIRSEYLRPVPGRDGKKMASRITVIEADCAGRKLRGISESTFAKNGAKELLKEASAPQAAWVDIGEQPALAGYFEAVCKTTPAS